MKDRSHYPVRKTTLSEQKGGSVLHETTAAERLEMVWQMSLDAWQVKERLPDEPRLRRDVVRVIRGRR